MTALVLQVIASFVTATGVAFAGVSLRGSQLQRNRQFEALYIQRYWDLIDELSAEVATGVRSDLSSSDVYVITRYVQLCEDEAELYARGWITDRTFQEWLPGILAQLRETPFATIWNNLDQEVDSESSSRKYAYLREVVSSGDAPKREVGVARRWIRGV